MTNPPRIAIPIFEIADNSLSSSSFLLAHSNATFPFLMHVFQECILQNVHAFVHFLYEKATTPLMHSKYSSGKCLLLSSTTNQRFILLPFPMAKIFRFRLSTTLLYIPLLQLSTGETAWAKIYTFKKKLKLGVSPYALGKAWQLQLRRAQPTQNALTRSNARFRYKHMTTPTKKNCQPRYTHHHLLLGKGEKES